MAKSKTILLTGASSGFGKLAVPLLIERGHRVIGGIRGGQERMKTIFPDLASAIASGQLSAVDLHMEQPETFQKARDHIREKEQGRLDVLINNAGYGIMAPIESQSPEQLRGQFEVNFFGPALLTRALMPELRAARGRVLNISSIAGLVSFPFYASYNASKFALEGLTEALYYEFEPFGIQVGMIEPGAFKTSFVKASLNESDSLAAADSPYRERMTKFNQLIRSKGKITGGNPIWVARLIVKLCERRRVPMRNIIGVDARFMNLIRRLLPDRVRIALLSFVFRKILLQE